MLALSTGKLLGQDIELCLSFQDKNSTSSQNISITWQKHSYTFFIDKDTCVSLPSPRSANFTLLLECNGYVPFQLTGPTDSLAAHARIDILLREKIIQLAPVIIKPEKRVDLRGDTLIIKTEGIDTRPHSDASELMQNIPGVYLSESGRLMIMGKRVSRITVDGKLLFGGNVKATLDALKSDMIEQLELAKISGEPGPGGMSLNLKLKENRKKGWYTDLTGGYAHPGLSTMGGKVNRIDPAYFLNGFINHNSLNENPISQQELSDLHTATYARSTQGAYSVLENAEATIFKQPNLRFYRLPAIDTDEGRNKFSSAGANFTKATQKLNLNTYLIMSDRKQAIVEQQSIFRRLGEAAQQVEGLKTSQNSEKQAWLALDGTYQLTAKETLKFTHTSSLGEQKQYRTSRNQIDEQSIRGAERTSIDQQLNESERPFLLANSLTWTHRYEKPAKVTSLYVNHFTERVNMDQFYANQYVTEQIDRTVNRSTQANYFQLQGIQSLPLTKKWLLEAKMDLVKDATQTRQVAFQPFNRPVPTQTLPLFQTTDNSLSTSLATYFKARKLTMTGGVTAWNGQLSRTKAPDKASNLTTLTWLPKLYANYSLSRGLSVHARYAYQVGLPSSEQLFPLPDSSNAQLVRQGNPALYNFITKVFNAGVSYSGRSGYVVTANFIRNAEATSIIPVNTFGTNGVIRSSYIQTDLLLPNYALTAMLISFPSTKKFSFFLTVYLANRISYVETGATQQAFKNQLGMMTADLRWKIKPTTSVSVLGKVQAVRQESLAPNIPNLNTRTEFTFRGNHRFSHRLYGAFSTLHLLNKPNQGTIMHFPFTDFNLDYYALKKQNLRISVTMKNAFNTTRQVMASSSGNQITQIYTNNLPRFFLLKLTAYLQQWQSPDFQQTQ